MMVMVMIGLVLLLILFTMTLYRQRLVLQGLRSENRQLHSRQQWLEQELDAQIAELTIAYRDRQIARQAKHTLMAHVSHEFRTPLAVIVGLSQSLRQEAELPHPQHHSLEVIYGCAEHLFEVISDVLMVAALEAQRVPLTLTDVDLDRLLETLEMILMPSAQAKGLELRCDRNLDVPRFIQTDSGKLRQILVHLFSNAIQYTPTGQVRLQISLAQPAQTLSPGETVQLCFSVIDTGIGIATENLNAIFQAFFQVNGPPTTDNHLGLGLTISQHLAQLLGGNLRVNSIVNQGSVFTCDIQATLVDPSPPLLSPGDQQVEALPGAAQYRVLIAVRQASVRQLLSLLLTRMGFDVQRVQNGRELLRLHHQFQHHLILLDPRLPSIHAVALIRQLKTAPHPPVIFVLVPHATPDDLVKMLGAGCDDFLHQPLSVQAIWQAIVAHLDMPAQGDATPPALSPEVLQRVTHQVKGMDAQGRRMLHHAAVDLNGETIVQLIDTVPFAYGELRQELMRLVQNFQYHLILDLLEELEVS